LYLHLLSLSTFVYDILLLLRFSGALHVYKYLVYLLSFMERIKISSPEKDLKLFLAKYGRFRIFRKIRRVYGSP
jgi:hypothetical protein